MANNISQKCVPKQSWPVVYDDDGVTIIRAGPPKVDTTRTEYLCYPHSISSQTDMRRKAEVLQHKKNSFKWTKQQRYAYLAKHPISRPSTNIVTPTQRVLCDGSTTSGVYILPTGDDGSILSSPSASNVPRDPLNDVQLYYDSTVPLTNWNNQVQFTEVGGYNGEIVKMTFDPREVIPPPILNNGNFSQAIAYYFGGGSLDTSLNLDTRAIGTFAANPNALSSWVVSDVTDMSGAFTDASGRGFNVNIDNWDVSNVTDMSDMFNGCESFNQTLNKWTVSNVTNMSNMFNGCELFDKPLNYWDVSNVENMSGMFNGCIRFNRTIAKWGVSNVTNMSNMFNNCNVFNQDISLWNVSNVTNMEHMFKGCASFNQSLNDWDVSGVTYMNSMFEGCGSLIYQAREWSVSINTVLNNMSFIFKNTVIPTIVDGKTIIDDIGNPIQLTVKELGDQYQNYFSNISDTFIKLNDDEFRDALSVYFQGTNQETAIGNYATAENNITYWDVSSVTDMSGAFSFTDASGFNVNIDNWDVSSVTDMSDMFNGCSDFNQPLDSWDVSNVTNMSNMFNNCIVFNQPINNWIVESVINMENMFSNCTVFSESLREWVMSINTVLNHTSNMFNGSGVQKTIAGITIIDGSGTPIMLPVDQISINEQDYFFKTNIFYANNLNFNAAIAIYFGLDGYGNFFTAIDLLQIGLFGHHITKNNISYWDVTAVTDMAGAFTVASGTGFNINISGWDVSNVTNMNSMFNNVSTFDQSIGGWNVSKVINMSNMFKNCSIFNKELYYWDTSIVRQTDGMFNGCTLFNENINNWDVSNVSNMSSMFRNCTNFNGQLNSWDMSDVLNTSNMFDGCSVFNKFINEWQLYSVTDTSNMFRNCVKFSNSISSWSLVSVINASNMFNGCINFDSDINIESFGDTENMSGMFSGCISFNQPLNEIDTSNVTDMSSMFQGCIVFDQPLNTWDVSNVTDTSSMFQGCIVFDQPLNTWDVSNVTDMSSMFQGCIVFDQSLNTWDVSNATNMSGLFQDCIAFNQPLNNWDVSNVTDTSSMFQACIVFDQPLNTWDVSNVTDMSSMFQGCIVFDQSLNTWDVSNVTDMSSMFQGCIVFDQSLNTWDVSNVINMSNMFQDCTVFNQPLNNWDVSNVATMSRMFNKCSNFNQDLTEWAPYNVIDFTSMFEECTIYNHSLYQAWIVSQLSELNRIAMFTDTVLDNLSNTNLSGGTPNTGYFFETIKITDNTDFTNALAYYFSDVSGSFTASQKIQIGRYTDINTVRHITTWDVSAVTDMSGAFSITAASGFNININSWDVSNVTNMNSMFNGCALFNQPLNDWDVSKVTDFTDMFKGCDVFNQELYNWSICVDSSVSISMSGMFEDCLLFNQSLNTDVSLNTWVVSRVTDMSKMFKNCAIFDQPLNKWDVSRVTDMSSLFYSTIPDNEDTDYMRDKLISTDYDYYELVNTVYVYDGPMSFNQPLNDWVVSSVTNMSYMFSGCARFNQELNDWDVSSVTNMSHMLTYCSVFNQQLDNWNVSNVTDMSYMFRLCRGFSTDSIAGWNVYNVMYMSYMFYDTDGYTTEVWNINPSVDLYRMFYSAMWWRDGHGPGETVMIQSVGNITMSGGTPTDYFFGPGILQIADSTINAVVDFYYNGTSTYPFSLLQQTIIGRSNHNTNKYNIAAWNVSQVEDMSGLFQGNTNITTLHLTGNGWDVSNVKNMSDMFNGCTNLDNTTDWNGNVSTMLYQWDVSNVTNMARMFKGCRHLGKENNKELFTLWDVSNVTDMSEMFSGWEELFLFQKNNIRFSQFNSWTVKNVTDMSGMFSTNLNVVADRNWPLITIWDVDIATTNVTEMFNINTTTTYPGPLPVDASGTPTQDYFTGRFIATDDNFYKAISAYYGETTEFTQAELIQIGSWHTDVSNNLTSDGWAVSERLFGSISYWDVSRVTNMSLAFKNRKMSFGLGLWDVSNVMNMKGMFYNMDTKDIWGLAGRNVNAAHSNANGLRQFIDKWDVSNVTDMSYMFAGSQYEGYFGKEWNVSKVTTMSHMFDGTNHLVIGSGTFNEIVNWDVSNVTDMSYMFKDAWYFVGDGMLDWNVSKVTNMSHMFYNCFNGEFRNTTMWNWDVSNVDNMNYMFHNFGMNRIFSGVRSQPSFRDDFATNWSIKKTTFDNNVRKMFRYLWDSGMIQHGASTGPLVSQLDFSIAGTTTTVIDSSGTPIYFTDASGNQSSIFKELLI